MKLSTMALRNIQLNFKKYVMYFFSLTFCVFTAYSFLALIQNEEIKQALTYDDRYQALLTSFGVIIMIFVLFFLLSSNNSFIKARKKEISTYALFGMTNAKIGKLLFLETMIIGVATLIIGIASGVFFSKLIAMILLTITLETFTGNISFYIDPISILLTVILFLIIFSIMGLSGLRVISKFQLVDLFKGAKLSEGKTKGSYIGLLFSLTLIGTGYSLATMLDDPERISNFTLLILLLVILGTYMFFWVGLPKLIHLLKNKKDAYYQGDNLIATSFLSHRVITISSTMATIAVLSAVGTTAIATGYTLYSNVENNTYDTIGYDMYYYWADENVLDSVYDTFDMYGTTVTDQHTVTLYETSPKTNNVVGGNIHYNFGPDNYFRIYSLSEFWALTSIAKKDIPLITLEEGKALYARNYYSNDLEEAIIGHELHFSEKTLEITSIINEDIGTFGALHTIVVNDSDYESLRESGDISTRGSNAHVFNYSNALSSRDLNNDLTAVLRGNVGSYRTAYTHFSEAMETFGLVCFIGFFMSVVFILMTASLLYFRQVVAAEEEKHQFQMLRKIGMDSSTEKKVITKRLFPIFFIPLVIGIIHSIFAMKAADTMIFTQIISVDNSYPTVLAFSAVMYTVYAVIYGVFYYITKSQYRRIVR
ncbi:ABC transporter permease [Evansella sp. AB-rgal1]|uniref:ABC transporter permease n=1 Tax=Evansella sp. AB-rgal1 TaxID=3242696 RepID=UPI00359CDBCD